MSSHKTVIHLPVTFVTPPGIPPQDYARFMAAEAALFLEKFSVADDITVGAETIDTIAPAYQTPADAPTATSNADAAGWADLNLGGA